LNESKLVIEQFRKSKHKNKEKGNKKAIRMEIERERNLNDLPRIKE